MGGGKEEETSTLAPKVPIPVIYFLLLAPPLKDRELCKIARWLESERLIPGPVGTVYT